jgi:hypothetical protein
VPPFRSLAIRLACAVLAASAFCFAFGRPLLTAALPLFDVVSSFAWPQYASRFEVVDDSQGAALQLRATTLRRIDLAAGNQVPVGVRFDPARQSLTHSLVPLAILLAGLAAWPLAGRRDLLLRLAAVVPLSLALLVLTVPFSLIGLVEMSVGDLKRAAGVGTVETWPIGYFIFLESGGRWLLPIVLAAACVVLCGMRRPRKDPREQVRYLGG